MSRSSNSSNSDASGSAEKRQAKRRRTKQARPASGYYEEKAELTPTQNNLSASFLTSSATNAGITPFTTLSGPPFLVDPTSNDRANIESLQRLGAMSSAYRLVQTAPLPTPALFPVLNSFPPLAMLTEPQQLLRYQLNAALQNVAIRELASGYLPSLGQYNPPTSLTMSNLEGINLANSRLGSMFMQPSFPPGLMAPAPYVLQHSRPRTAPFARVAVPNEARDYDSQVFEDGRQAVVSFAGSHDATPASSGNQEKRKHCKRKRSTSDDGSTEIILFVSEDYENLNDHQIYLRKQIELFRATQDDIFSYTRGKNKPIFVQQVGIRCRHCSHIPVGMRRKGSTYFPSNLMGIYQAAQNLNVEHLQSGLCPETPPDVRNQFMEFASTKAAASGVGKKYWAEAAQKLGLVDTEDGIRFAADMH